MDKMIRLFCRHAQLQQGFRARFHAQTCALAQIPHASAKPSPEQSTPEIARRNLSKILIANRGEIACRIIRTARKMGIDTVAVYSDPDRASLHVDMADEAYRIGPASTNESYLNAKRIIDAALNSGAQAIHPGYGFLSQSPEFAQLCADNDIVFIGPSPRSIRDMGIKSTSKTLMEAAGVPVIQGYHGDDQNVERLRAEAKKIGFPVMIKAFRGGGGKGMRVAMHEGEFDQQLESAKRESIKSFGDDAMLVEKYVQRPRHVEVQVFGDHYGNCVYLFERDCSVQRRHQKIIEEAPAPGISWETRKSIGEAAVRAAKAVDYVGAGTVEFILDSKQHAFYFMEMNTRLQVEHPVTEMITGTDLVAWQLKVAAGEPLPMQQKDLRINGHSFEARVYAENPEDNFMPGAGPLTHLSVDFDPAQFGGTVRVESGVRQGDEVSVHYDPMIAKLVVWGEDRATALQKLRNLLNGYHISGLPTNINFLARLCDNPSFQAAEVHTDFIKEHFKELFPDASSADPTSLAEAALGVLLSSSAASRAPVDLFSDPFDVEKNWRMNHAPTRNVRLRAGGKDYDVQVVSGAGGKYVLKCLGKEMVVEGQGAEKDGAWEIKALVDGRGSRFKLVSSDGQIQLFRKNGSTTYDLPAHKYESLLSHGQGGAGEAIAPMPGVVEKILVQPGQNVSAGDPLIVMIAMKMEYVIKAPKAGVIKKVAYKPGDNVKKGDQLVYYEESETGTDKGKNSQNN
ncbi:methylcrotonoyl-CoA carboxylase subunit alpha, mitochondrial-like [Paramacrobiotus metropolitanus]|uniref:methylcrotonoyl-CoA carboxylase subunit alpha, mitochondrial-like n=1 Tax=Paramacrobiotus metropolitanus TaxID=2943436 RepID=UPI002445D6E8|nr:methylcrotonoyl-CoA carboxylase subunit alpha, mitochondrial-like [Paramacrobiotus metropolitanus]